MKVFDFEFDGKMRGPKLAGTLILKREIVTSNIISLVISWFYIDVNYVTVTFLKTAVE
jgi:hypothetical protein